MSNPFKGALLTGVAFGTTSVFRGAPLAAHRRGSATITPAPTPSVSLPDIAPVASWRLPITQATSSQTAFNAALVASGDGAKTWPASSSIASGATFVLPVQIAAVAAPGGLLSYLWTTNNGSFTLTVEQSFDSTNGADGTWATIPSPFYQASGLSPAGKGQVVRLASGPGRWVRLTFAAASASGTVRLKAHQLPASGRAFLMGTVGASKESLGFLTIDAWTEITNQFPAYDPVLLDYSNGGILGPAITANLSKLYSDVPEVQYVYGGQFGGNDVTSNRPYASVSQSTRDQIAANFDSFINTGLASGKPIFFVDLDYRNYAAPNAVNGTAAQENGSKPFNDAIYGPRVQALVPDQYDAARATPFMHPYSPIVQKPWYVSTDGIHETARGFNVLRREIVRTIIGRVITGAYPAKPFETLLVEKAEASVYHPDKVAGLNAVSALPDSAYKTAMLARLNAVAAPLDQVQFSFGGTGGRTTPNWNVIGATNVVGSAVTSPTRVDGAVATGVSATVTTAASAVTTSGGGDTGFDSGPVPDDITDQNVRCDTGATWTLEITVPGTSYKVEALSTFVGSYSTRTAAIGVNGTVKNRNPSDNRVVDVWDAVTPVGGKITVTLTTASGSSRSYLSMVRLTKLG